MWFMLYIYIAGTMLTYIGFRVWEIRTHHPGNATEGHEAWIPAMVLWPVLVVVVLVGATGWGIYQLLEAVVSTVVDWLDDRQTSGTSHDQ